MYFAIMALPVPRRFSRNIDGCVFPDTIYKIFAAGAQNNVPVIVGSVPRAREVGRF